MLLRTHSFYYISTFFFFGVFSYAQSISGKISNKEGKSLPYVEIMATKGLIKKGAISDQNGKFLIKLPENGNYLLQVVQGDNKSYNKNTNVTGDTTENVTINVVEEQIQEIKLTAQKKLIERKVDRLVFNVENSISALGTDAADLLKLAPGVEVTGNSFSIIGRSSVNILINDRLVQLSGESLMNYLKTIPSDRIQKVEIITNPPAKYDAAGNSGIINIQLKPMPKENSWNVLLNSSAEFATFPTLSHGANFTYKKNKFSMLAGLNYKYGNKIYTNDILYNYPNNETWQNNIYNRRNSKTLGALLNLQYIISDKKSLGFQYSGSFINTNIFENNRSQNYIANTLAKDYPTEGNTISKPNINSLNLNYNQKFDSTGKKFSVDLDYFTSSSPKDNNFTSEQRNLIDGTSQFITANNTGKQNIENYSAKTDFEMPYKWASLSFGAKVSSTKTKNIVDAQFFTGSVDPLLYNAQYDHFEYTENIQTLYISADKSFNDKWSLKLGLRGEYTQTKSNSITTNQLNRNQYFKLFPTAYILYKANKEHSFSLDFGRRIGRPAFWELNPARWYMNAQSYTEGNPFLQPSYSYNFQLGYSFKSLVNVGMYYSITEDGFGQVTYHDITDNTQIFKRQNYYNGKDTGGWIILNFNPMKWWESTVTATAFYKESNNYIPLFNRDFSGWGGYTKVNNVFTLNPGKTLMLSLDYHYNYAGRNRETAYTDYSYVNVGLKSLLLKKKLILGLNFEDILKDNISTYSSYSGEVRQSFTQYNDTRLVRLSVSYNFGNNKVSVGKRNVGNQEERNRSN